MEVIISISGIRYYDLKGRWEQLFEADGTLKRKFVGRHLTLRRDEGNPVTSVVSASSDGMRWGNVCDDEKELPLAVMENNHQSSMDAVIMGGDAHCRLIQVSVSMAGMPPCRSAADTNPLAEWERRWTKLPVMEEPIDEVKHLRKALDSLEDKLCEGLCSREDVSEVIRWMRYDLSVDSHRRECKLAQRLAGKHTDESMLLTGAIVGMGGADSLKWWAEEGLKTIERSQQVQTMMRLYAYTPREMVEQALQELPGHYFRKFQINPVRMIARLYYRRLPYATLNKVLSAIVFLRLCPHETPSLDSTETANNVHLSDQRGTRIDIIRVLNTLYELGYFVGPNGSKLMKKDFFNAMGQALNMDFSHYYQDLSRSLSDSTALDKHLAVFDKMREKMIEIFNSK